MREAHPVERAVGMAYYVSDADGVGGRLRDRPADFRVRELEAFDPEPVGADPGSYPYLLLRATLEGWDTNDFARRLASAMGISRERVDWAGTKDKHAVTTQLFTVRGVDPGDLPAVRDADIEVLGRAGRGLQFGDLAGNAFEVVVRDPERPENVAPVTADLRAFAGVAGGGSESPDAQEPGDCEAWNGKGNRNRNRNGVETGDWNESGNGNASGNGNETGEEDERGNANGNGNGGGATVEETRVAVPNFFGQQRFGSRRPITHEVGLHVVRGEWREAVLAYVADPHEAEPESTREARAFVAREAGSDDPDWAACLDRFPERLRYERSMLHRLDERGADGDEDWRHALEAVPSNLQALFVHAAQSYVFNRVLSERLEQGLPFDRPVAGDVCAFADREAPEGIDRPDTDRLQRVDEGRLEVLTRHCERGRAFVTAPLVGTGTDLANGEPGEIERGVLAEVGLEPADFSLPGAFDSTGTRRAVLVRTDLSVEREPLSFAFALPSGSYATALLREYLKVGPLAR